MVETCEMEVPRQKLLECPPCTEIFFSRVSRVNFGRVAIVVTRRYLLRMCYLGLAVGQHIHSLTLLPQEEVEIEIVRRSRFSRALHEQRSVESEFRYELQNTSRDEWSSEEESNFKVTAEAGFKLFGFGAKTSAEYSRREKTAEKHFREIISKTSSKVSQKYEIAIDTKTEVENQYRSVRKVTNPNPCQPVIYNYFQFAKKYRTELILTDVRFDFLPLPPRILTDPLRIFTIAAESFYRQNLNLQVVAAPPTWRLQSAAVVPTVPVTQLAQLAATHQIVQPMVSLAAPLAPVGTQVPTEPPDVMELTKEELLDKIKGKIADEAAFKRELDTFLKEDVNKLGVRDKYEYCINTEGMYVEATVSKCSPCDKATLELRQLEVEKAKLELELMKKGKLRE